MIKVCIFDQKLYVGLKNTICRSEKRTPHFQIFHYLGVSETARFLSTAQTRKALDHGIGISILY